MKFAPLVLILSAGVNSCIGNMLLKWSRMSLPDGATQIEKMLSPGLFGGLFFYAVNVVLFAQALETMQVSIAYPILAGSGFALLTLTSAFFFNEPITANKMIGISIILAGIVLAAAG